jgi:hypothetical protein
MSKSEQILVISLLIVGAVAAFIYKKFKRRIGAIDPKTGKPGGSDTEAYAVVMFLLALGAALYITYSAGGEAVG